VRAVPEDHHDPAALTFGLLGVGVVAVSFSGPIAAATAAPALAVAFWRNALGAAAVLPFASTRRRAELARVLGSDRRVLARAVAAGLVLAVHFGLWIPSLRLTSVTAATALVTTAPLFTMVADRLGGRRVPSAVVVGVLTSVVGVLVITGVDASSSPRALTGDLLALGGGAAAAGYTLLGASVRRTMSTTGYTSLAYTVCALALVPVCLLAGAPLAGYAPRTWAELAVLTLTAQLLGHSLLNRALRSVGATTVSLAVLLEVPGATLVAWTFWGQSPPAATLPGAALLLAGLAVVVRAGASSRRRAADQRARAQAVADKHVEVLDVTPL
jgi:drug/metabolite transporter (DMT)-like permease